jgi:hypothetical protein
MAAPGALLREPNGCSRICLTLDIDWAPDDIIRHVLWRLEEAGVKATLFATHESRLLASLGERRFEIGLHPNFNNAQGDFESPLRKLKALYPRARGGRSHHLYVSSHILQLYRKYGLKYESNIFLPYHSGLHPVLYCDDLVSVPFFWSDDYKYASDTEPLELKRMVLHKPGLKVFNFHPTHVYMNTYAEEHYKAYKPHYQDPAALEPHINRSRPGVGTFFADLLDYIAAQQQETYTLSEVCDEYLATLS